MSIKSEGGIPVAEIARLAGHSSTRSTEAVYRRELRPVISTGAVVMDRIFGEAPGQVTPRGHRPDLPTPEIPGNALLLFRSSAQI